MPPCKQWHNAILTDGPRKRNARKPEASFDFSLQGQVLNGFDIVIYAELPLILKRVSILKRLHFI